METFDVRNVSQGKGDMFMHFHSKKWIQKGHLAHITLADDAKMAYETKNTVKGMKGPCWLSQFKSYDLICSTGIDHMHSDLVGVMLLLMLL